MLVATEMKLRRLLLPCLLATAFALAAAPARADDGDTVHFASAIHVTADAPTHDAVCIFCSVYVDGKVTGDIVVIFGNVHLNGDAQHDVVNIFGNVTAEKGSTVENDLVSVFGNVRLADNVLVSHDLVSVFGDASIPDSVIVGGDRVERSGWIIGIPLLILLAIVFIVVREYRTFRHRLAARTFPPVKRP
jgi:hypothetical protein